jgi:hypothetical protein
MRSFMCSILLLAACGDPTVDPVPPVPPAQAQRFVLAPDYGVDLSSDYWAANTDGIVISNPSTSKGPAPEALAKLFVDAAPISTPVKNAATGLVKGAQLPLEGCILVANCDGSVCTDQALTLKFQ